MVFCEHGLGEEVVKCVSNFIGASTLEIQVVWFSSLTLYSFERRLHAL